MSRNLISILIICVACITNSFSQSNIRYVSLNYGTPAGDGLSWATASDDLQAMIDDVPSEGSVYLEEGVYKPKAYPFSCTGCFNSRDFAFYSNKNINIVGGFYYGGTTPFYHPKNTIISGDIGIANDISDNCYHVIISNNHIHLEQLTISHGNANSGGSIVINGVEYQRNNGGGVLGSSGSIKMHYVMLSHNTAYDKGGGIYGKNVFLYVRKCVINNNVANQGGGLYLINDNYQSALIEKTVIANNTASQGGAMYISDPPRVLPYIDYFRYTFKINYCTYYGNTAADGSVVWAPHVLNSKMIFANSVVYGNSTNIYNYAAPNLPATNSIVQGGSLIGYATLRTELPDFINPIDLDGADNLFFTDDDGLVPQVTGKAALTNIGAYLWNTTLCPDSAILYVDINNPTPGDGSSWAAALPNLNSALSFARRCNVVQEIHVAEGVYVSEVYNWYGAAFDYHIVGNSYQFMLSNIGTAEIPTQFLSATYILRPGLKVFGGYPTGGGLRNPSIHTSELTGTTRNLVSIHEPNTNPLDTTVLDGFTIKGGYATFEIPSREVVTLDPPRIELILYEVSYYSTGGGIKIHSDYVKIKNNIIKDNAAFRASAIEIDADHVEISNNEIKNQTTSLSTISGYERKGSLITLSGDSCNINYNIITNNLLGVNSVLLDIKGNNHEIKGNDINSNPSLPIFLQSYKSTCSFNSIKNNYGHGIKILGDSCIIHNNNIENNYEHGIFTDIISLIYDDGRREYITIYTKIHDNIIKSNQKSGIFISNSFSISGNTNSADVYNNTISNNIENGVEGDSKVWSNIISNNQTGITGSDSIWNNTLKQNNIAINCGFAAVHHNIIENNLSGINIGLGRVFNNYINGNGRGLNISLGEVFNNTFVNNLGIDAGGLQVRNNLTTNTETSELHITNNTFYGNKASNSNGAGAIYISKFKGDTIEISNNIFWDNGLGVFTSIPGADYRYDKLEVDYPPIFKNNMLQLTAPLYNGADNTDLGSGSVNNIFNTFPNFVSLSDWDGPDNIYMTRDDGLSLNDVSLGIDAGFDLPIVSKTSIDISGLPRVLGPHTDIGAYEKINCASLDTIYVNKNHTHTTGGAGWRSPVIDLNIALFLAHECPNVSVINVSADEYQPSDKPYEMQPGSTGVQMITANERDKTFHIRTGVNLYGGYIVRGDTAMRDPSKFRTVLNGQLSDTSVLHTVMMSYHSGHWSNPLDTTVMDGFNITGGMANEPPTNKLTVNGNDMYKSNGGGVSIFGGTNKISNCTIESNTAKVGGGLYFDMDTTVVLRSLIKQNQAETAAGIATAGGKYEIVSNTFFDNNAETTAALYIKNGNNLVINNVFFDNQSLQKSGALSLNQGVNKVVNNTFFNNNSTEVGALYIDGGNTMVSNNIFHRNKKNNLYDVVGSDYQHSIAPLSIDFNNNHMQIDKPSDYKIGNQNELGTGLANIFDINPIFYDTLDINGEDNKYGTFDDGLRLLIGSPMINIGENTSVPSYITQDIYGSPRIQKGIVELGAYEGGNVRCPEGLFDTLFVDLSVMLSGNGSSWSQAFKTLDEAIFITHMCPFIKFICIAEGTYYPNAKPYNMYPYLQGLEVETTDPRDATFHIRDGVVLLGGYSSGGTIRDINIYHTILSGDINQNDIDNVYHTCIMSASPYWFIRIDTTIIDGVQITKAKANNKGYTLMVNNNPLNAGVGAGIFMTKGYHAVKHSILDENNSQTQGGGVYGRNTKNVTLSHNTITENTSVEGAGIFMSKCDFFDLGYNTLSSNNALEKGGAMFLDTSENVLHHNKVSGNSANFGGGYFIKGPFIIEDSDFLLNGTGANGKGGGIFTTKSHGTIDRCVFDRNITDLHGGGLYTYECDSLFLWNSVFNGNVASNVVSLGGAVYNDKNDYFEEVNCTTYANSADQGNSIYILSNNPILKNNILWDINPISVLTGTLTLSNSIVKGGHPDCSSCPGAMGDIDPLFKDNMDIDGPDNKYRTEDDGLNVKSASIALDIGTPYRSIAHDITYKLRNWGHRDIGAYEYFKCPLYDTLYVDKLVSGGKGLNWATAINETSIALYVAHTCPDIEEIHVAKADYLPSYKPFEMQADQTGIELYTIDNKDKTFHVRPGLYLFGGYKSGGTNRDRDLFPSTLSGDIASGENDALHVVLLASDAAIWTGLPKVTIDGFQIEKGHAKNYNTISVNSKNIKNDVGAGIYGDYDKNVIINNNAVRNNLGSGIYMYGGINTVSNNIISANQGGNGGGAYFTKGINTLLNNEISNNTAGFGGGLYVIKDSIILSDNNIHDNNTTYYWGGGLYVEKSSINLFNNNIESNISKYGGGAFFEQCSFRIDSNTINNNHGTTYGGGGMQIMNSNGRFYKNRVTSNFTSQSGGGLSIFNGSVTLESNLFSKNKASGTGGGLAASYGSLLVINNVFYSDTAASGSGIQTYSSFNEIKNNTFFNNEGSAKGGAFASSSGVNDLINNIFYQNSKAGNSAAIGADVYNDEFNESINLFVNNALQFDEITYSSDNNNVMYVNTNNVFNVNPQFEDEFNVSGPDLVFGTIDDGLRLSTTSPCVNIGNKNLIPDSILFDAKYEQRVMNFQIDLGAYETFRNQCISNVIHVDTNRISSGTGDSWATAFQTLSEALFVAHNCPDVDSILIAEGTYYSETKPYQMDVNMKGQEINTYDVGDLTFHIRQGLSLIGGYPGGGDESPSAYYKTILTGRKPASFQPSYHTVLMDTSAMWINANKKSSIQYCVIQDGVSADQLTPDSIMVNGFWVYNTKGAGIYINGSESDLKYNNIKDNEAAFGAGVFIGPSAKVLLENNEISSNLALIEGGGLLSDQAEITLLNNVIMLNFCIRQDLRGLLSIDSLIKLFGNNVIEGVSASGGIMDVNGQNVVK